MSGPVAASRPLRTSGSRSAPRRLLAAVGRPIVRLLRWLAVMAGFSAAILLAACRRITWRRPVRAEFMRTMRQAGVEGVRPAIVAGALVGLAMVYQALYWLQAAGQADLIGQVLVLVLVRELAPLVISLIVIGRTGVPMLIQLSRLRAGGQLRMLQAQGVEPFLLLVMPRVLACALSVFCLSIVFLATALLVGYFTGTVAGALRLPLYDFLDNLLHAMKAAEYVLLPVKTLALGFVIGMTISMVLLAPAAAVTDVGQLTAAGFVRSVFAVFIVSGMLDLVL